MTVTATAVSSSDRTRRRVVTGCPCGAKHSIPERTYGRVQRAGGATSTVVYGNGNCGAYRVPRIWMVCHGWPGQAALRGLAEEHGWERVA